MPFAETLHDPADPAVFDIAVQSIVNRGLYEAMDALSEREAGILALRYGLASAEPETLAAIGAVYGITRERVRQIELKALGKLRKEAVRGRLDGVVDHRNAVVRRGA